MRHLSYAGYAQRIISEHLARLCHETERIRLSADNVEAVHQARVASRRIRNAFWVFRDILPEKKLKVWKEMLRREAAVLGAARDLDIQTEFLEKIEKDARAGAHGNDLDRLLRVLRKRRQEMTSDLSGAAGGLIESAVLDRIKETVKLIGKNDAGKGRHKLYALAKEKIRKRLTNFLGYEIYVPRPECSAELHRMRIAAKKLRYTLENFEPLYGKRTRRFIGAAHKVQDLLGEIHDIDVWIRSYPDLIRESHRGKTSRAGVKRFTSACHQLRDKLYLEFAAYWEALKTAGVWEETAGFISSFDRRGSKKRRHVR